MAEYLVLIYESEAAYSQADGSVYKEVMDAHEQFSKKHAAALRGGNALHPTTTATSIRGGDSGDAVLTDGAFAETKEGLGGYYLIEADDLDAAIAIAKDVPSRFGGVEVRPVMVFD